ncbi:septum formation initiator family protein, partial [Streptomyces sp. t39]|uniref:FtsB family cell division protein n=1 Tax=Streptomyces sp. t39 TaxID=1828156 RepID=UPI003966ADC0
MPSGPSSAARTPFVLLVVLLLSGGLITLLLLNSSLSQGSFRLSELKKQTTELTDQEQALQRDVDSRSAPDALERRARELGMVPGGSPAFLGPDGTVRGVPGRATAQPAPTPSAGPSPDEEPAGQPAAPATPSVSAPGRPGQCRRGRGRPDSRRGPSRVRGPGVPGRRGPSGCRRRAGGPVPGRSARW